MIIDLDKWHEIYSALKKNKLRTFLTAFGVSWGIFMLIIMLGTGNGLWNGVNKDFEDFATNSVYIWTNRTSIPYKGLPRGRHFNFDNDDTKALKENIPEIDIVAPKIRAWNFGGSGNNVVRGNRYGAFSIHGDYPEFNKIDPVEILKGRFINQLDIKNKRKVAVIGTRVYEILFMPDENPIGKYIRIQGVYFQVVGLFRPINKNMGRGDKEETIYLPLTTLQRAYNYGETIGFFSITSKPDIPVSVVEEKAMKLLAKRHSIHPDDMQAFGHFNMEERFNQMKGLFRGINLLIWMVGIGTLMAGVIGVSNIMLVIIKERTKEIGIKRALGAKPASVIGQIISESIFLTSFAGYFGLTFGVMVIELANRIMDKMGASGSGSDTMFDNPEVNIKIALIALGILVVSGALAGLIPAQRAVSVKPVDAIRNE